LLVCCLGFKLLFVFLSVASNLFIVSSKMMRLFLRVFFLFRVLKKENYFSFKIE